MNTRRNSLYLHISANMIFFSPSLHKMHVLHSVMIEENLMKRLLENLSLMKFLENDLDLENDSYMVSSKISIHGDTLVK